jgi:general secretion pathway protein A
MYVDYFGLTTKPFQITSDPTFLWLGEKHKEALATLRYGIQDNRGFLLLTGEVGTGKTILVNKLISLLDSHTIVATLPDPDLDSMDFYKLLADSLKMSRPFHSKAEFLIQFREFLHQCHASHNKVLLIIDECQRLKHHMMEEIRVLSNIELQDRKLINIFFVGQPEFNGMLMAPKNRALSQRITVRYNIEVLDQQETYDYINYRLKVAGSKKPIFRITALNEIFLFSGGIPRLVNIVCDHALLTAFSKNIKQVDAHIIRECAEELRIPVEMERSNVATIRTKEEAYSNAYASRQPRPGASEPDKRKIADILWKCWNAITLPTMPMRWKLIYYLGILLLLAALVIAITYNSGAPTGSAGDRDGTSKENITAPENPQGRQPDHPSPAKRITGERPPAGASPAVDIAAVNVATAKTRTETLPAIEAGVNAEPRIGPLPLLEEKTVIQFNFNSNEVEDGAYAALNRIAFYLKTHPEQRIILKGYSDSSGSPGFNETVSDFRANAVKSYLIAKGAKADQMTIQALGASDPIASNATVTGRGKNRRVEIEFLKNQ